MTAESSAYDPPAPSGSSIIRPVARVVAAILALVLLALIAAGAWFYIRLRGSLPQLEGKLVLAGLFRPVTVERDDLGVPTIVGDSRNDVARALGFVHGQDRFFQMDLSRRRGAGELAELVGASALPADRLYRRHRFRWRAQRLLESAPPEQLALLRAYTDGVNAGLDSLDVPPFEYLVLAEDPAAWQEEDTLLVGYAMYFTLHDQDASRESAWGLLHDVLGPEMYEFLAPLGTEWDAPLVGGPVEAPPIPGPEILNRRDERSVASQPQKLNSGLELDSPVTHGSNNWVVAGNYTAHGGAILANDMHLELRVPNIWYRASLVYPSPHDASQVLRITGVTLPGTPFVLAGSNGHVAWGFTNTWADWIDLVLLEPVEGEPDQYRTLDGPKDIERLQEVVRTKDGEAIVVEIMETIWGPILDQDHLGNQRAMRWIAHDPGAVNLEMIQVEQSRTVPEVLAAANRVGAPPQNFVAADADGRIGWTVMGQIPRRFGFDGRLPSSWADGSRGWDGYLQPEEYPRIVEPEGGRLWTANNRLVDGEMLARLGTGDYVLGARARQIRDALLALDRSDEQDHLAIQLDDRALFLDRWQRFLLDVLTPEAVAENPLRGELRHHVADWGKLASVDSVGFRMVRAFRIFLGEQVFDSLTAPCKEADVRFDYNQLHQFEGPLWQLVNEKPLHLLDPQFESWHEQSLAAVDFTLDYFLRDGSSLEKKTWGDRNTTRIRHPLSSTLRVFGRWLDMPATQQPGDSHMPRFQSITSGSSQRMVVSPGREDKGFFHMPTGQSSHPLSQHYRDGHQAWAEGLGTPFLPGPTVRTLTLVPPGQ